MICCSLSDQSQFQDYVEIGGIAMALLKVWLRVLKPAFFGPVVSPASRALLLKLQCPKNLLARYFKFSVDPGMNLGVPLSSLGLNHRMLTLEVPQLFWSDQLSTEAQRRLKEGCLKHWVTQYHVPGALSQRPRRFNNQHWRRKHPVSY